MTCRNIRVIQGFEALARWRSRLAGLIAAACATAMLSASPALADGEARDALFARMTANPTDYEAGFTYARAAIEARDYEAAIGVLERMLFYNPGLSRAKFELGNLYFRLASNAMAVRYFEEALADESLDPELRARVAAYLPMARKELSPDRVYGLLETGVRYNSNPASLPSSSVISSLGLLAPNAANGGDAAAFALGDLRYIHDFQNERGDTFEARVQAYATGQFRDTQLGVGLVNLEAGPRLAIAPDALPGATVHPYFAYSSAWLGGALYSTAAGGGLSARFPLSAWFYLEPGAEWRRAEIHDPAGALSQATVNTGDLWTGSLAAHWAARDRVTVDGRAFYVGNRASSSALSSTQGGVEASVKFDFDPPEARMPLLWSITPFARYTRIAFDAANPALLSAAARRDSQWRGGAQLDMPITDALGFTALTQYTRNDSNLARFQSSAWSASLGATLRY